MLWLRSSSPTVWVWELLLLWEATTSFRTMSTSELIKPTDRISILHNLWIPKILNSAYNLISFQQRCPDRVYRQLKYIYVRWVCHLLRGRFHGPRAAEASCRSSRFRYIPIHKFIILTILVANSLIILPISIFRSGTCLPCLPFSRTRAPRSFHLVLPLLLHVTSHWSWQPILHHGRFYHRCRWRVA